MQHFLSFCFDGGNLNYSIIIPVLNEEKLLPVLLSQLSDKTLKKKYQYEIIISDGGSTDATLSIATKLADKIISHTLPGNQNIAMGRNRGAEHASADILIFLNGDVRLNKPEEFFLFVENNFKNSSYLAMTCCVRVFPEEETISDKLFHLGYNSYFRLLNNAGIGMGRGECQIIRKSVFNEVRGYNETLAAGEDFDLFRRIRKLGKTLFTKELFIFESPRRFRKLGYLNVTLNWVKNGFSVFLKNKSISKEWEAVR